MHTRTVGSLLLCTCATRGAILSVFVLMRVRLRPAAEFYGEI